MPRTTKVPKAAKANDTPPSAPPTQEVLTLAEAAAYLRLPESEVIGLVHSQGLPGRFSGSEWRFLKSAIQEWLRTGSPPPKGTKEAWLAMAGVFKDDPDLEKIVEEAYRRRGRPITEGGSYKNFSG
jgi:excisionase family DNA binding protein